MSQESFHPNKPPSQAESAAVPQSPQFPEIARPPTPLENAIIQATPEAGKVPSRFKTTVKTLADAWFDPKSFEGPEVYEKLGVRTIKKYMPTGGNLILRLVRKKVGGGGLVEGNLASLKNMEHFTRLYEATHVAAFSIMAANIGAELALGEIKTAIAVSALNIVTNVFPIMLQRYNRTRLYRTIRKMEERQKSSPTAHPDTSTLS